MLKTHTICTSQMAATSACHKNGPLATSLPRACQALATSLPGHWPPKATTLNRPTPCHAACHAAACRATRAASSCSLPLPINCNAINGNLHCLPHACTVALRNAAPEGDNFCSKLFFPPCPRQGGKKVHEHSDRPYMQHSF